MKKISVFIFIVCLLFAPQVVFASLILNGGFEAPDVSGTFVTYKSGSLPPASFLWSVGFPSTDSQMDHINSYWQGVSGTTNPDGYDQSVDIDIDAYIWQTFSTTIGMQYDLSLWYAHNPDGSGSSKGYVSVDGNSALLSTTLIHNTAGATRGNMKFANYISTFVADSATTKLKIQGDENNWKYGFVVDNVNITPIPEPASLSLLGLGLFGLAGFRRKKI